ncbi:MAG: hypothetical protein R3B09_04980 [Nannocystaceae bacterium]
MAASPRAPLLALALAACGDDVTAGATASSSASSSSSASAGTVGDPTADASGSDSAGTSATATASSSATSAATTDAETGGPAPDLGGPPPRLGERLYIGTGEYLATQDWHGILRFDHSEALDSAVDGPFTPDATVNVQASADAGGTHLNFVHTIFVDDDADELYAGALFTTEAGMTCPMASECGSVAIFAGASTMDGPQIVSRHLYGPKTGLLQPHGVWVDRSRDTLYVANTFAGQLLAWESASTVDGDLAPTRTLTWPEMGAPVFLYVDEPTDRAFVAVMPMIGGKRPGVLIYPSISTLDGVHPPTHRIQGPSTRLEVGNQTTHNVWFIAEGELLVVAHHTNEVLIYDLSGLEWGATGPTQDHDLTPRVLEIHETADDQGKWSAYGIFYIRELDRLYVSAGYTPMGPAPNSPEHAVKIYEGVHDPRLAGQVAPAREIRWTNVGQYFPPQPLWVTRE